MHEITLTNSKNTVMAKVMKVIFFFLLAGSFSYSLMPNSVTLPDKFGLSHILHFLAFVTLAFTMDLAYPRLGNLRKVWVLTGFGILIEAVQYFIPYRFCSFWDLMVDVLGIAAYFLGIQQAVKGLATKPF